MVSIPLRGFLLTCQSLQSVMITQGLVSIPLRGFLLTCRDVDENLKWDGNWFQSPSGDSC